MHRTAAGDALTCETPRIAHLVAAAICAHGWRRVRMHSHRSETALMDTLLEAPSVASLCPAAFKSTQTLTISSSVPNILVEVSAQCAVLEGHTARMLAYNDASVHHMDHDDAALASGHCCVAQSGIAKCRKSVAGFGVFMANGTEGQSYSNHWSG